MTLQKIIEQENCLLLNVLKDDVERLILELLLVRMKKLDEVHLFSGKYKLILESKKKYSTARITTRMITLAISKKSIDYILSNLLDIVSKGKVFENHISIQFYSEKQKKGTIDLVFLFPEDIVERIFISPSDLLD